MKIVNVYFLASGASLIGLFMYGLCVSIMAMCKDSFMQVSCVTKDDIVFMVWLMIMIIFITTLVYKVHTQANSGD